ncbi:MAG: hypothetical protein AB8G11_01320, partial [Saprospiraceae bacterium]
MGRKTINIKPTGFNTSYSVTVESLTACAKIVNGQNLVTELTISDVTAAQTPFEIDFGTCDDDITVKVTVVDLLDCTKVVQQIVVNPYKTICEVENDFGLDFGFETVVYDPHVGLDPISDAHLISFYRNTDYIRYRANKTGTFSNPADVTSDTLEYSLDGGVTWLSGDKVERYNAFNTFAKVIPICFPYQNNAGAFNSPSNYFGFQVFSGRFIDNGVLIQDGNGANFQNPLSIEFNIGASLINQSSSNINSYGVILETFSDFGLTSPQNDMTTANWINNPIINYEAELEFDDGYIFKKKYTWNCPYTSLMGQKPTCDGVIDDATPIIRAGSQKQFKWRRTITFNNGCPTIVKEYDINIVE